MFLIKYFLQLIFFPSVVKTHKLPGSSGQNFTLNGEKDYVLNEMARPYFKIIGRHHLNYHNNPDKILKYHQYSSSGRPNIKQLHAAVPRYIVELSGQRKMFTVRRKIQEIPSAQSKASPIMNTPLYNKYNESPVLLDTRRRLGVFERMKYNDYEKRGGHRIDLKVARTGEISTSQEYEDTNEKEKSGSESKRAVLKNDQDYNEFDTGVKKNLINNKKFKDDTNIPKFVLNNFYIDQMKTNPFKYKNNLLNTKTKKVTDFFNKRNGEHFKEGKKIMSREKLYDDTEKFENIQQPKSWPKMNVLTEEAYIKEEETSVEKVKKKIRSERNIHNKNRNADSKNTYVDYLEDNDDIKNIPYQIKPVYKRKNNFSEYTIVTSRYKKPDLVYPQKTKVLRSQLEAKANSENIVHKRAKARDRDQNLKFKMKFHRSVVNSLEKKMFHLPKTLVDEKEDFIDEENVLSSEMEAKLQKIGPMLKSDTETFKDDTDKKNIELLLTKNTKYTIRDEVTNNEIPYSDHSLDFLSKQNTRQIPADATNEDKQKITQPTQYSQIKSLDFEEDRNMNQMRLYNDLLDSKVNIEQRAQIDKYINHKLYPKQTHEYEDRYQSKSKNPALKIYNSLRNEKIGNITLEFKNTSGIQKVHNNEDKDNMIFEKIRSLYNQSHQYIVTKNTPIKSSEVIVQLEQKMEELQDKLAELKNKLKNSKEELTGINYKKPSLVDKIKNTLNPRQIHNHAPSYTSDYRESIKTSKKNLSLVHKDSRQDESEEETFETIDKKNGAMNIFKTTEKYNSLIRKQTEPVITVSPMSDKDSNDEDIFLFQNILDKNSYDIENFEEGNQRKQLQIVSNSNSQRRNQIRPKKKLKRTIFTNEINKEFPSEKIVNKYEEKDNGETSSEKDKINEIQKEINKKVQDDKAVTDNKAELTSEYKQQNHGSNGRIKDNISNDHYQSQMKYKLSNKVSNALNKSTQSDVSYSLENDYQLENQSHSRNIKMDSSPKNVDNRKDYENEDNETTKQNTTPVLSLESSREQPESVIANILKEKLTEAADILTNEINFRSTNTANETSMTSNDSRDTFKSLKSIRCSTDRPIPDDPDPNAPKIQSKLSTKEDKEKTESNSKENPPKDEKHTTTTDSVYSKYVGNNKDVNIQFEDQYAEEKYLID